MVIRSYFDRNNTIVKDSTLNTGQNPVAELFYGGDLLRNYSRFIFGINLERIRDLHENGFYPNISTLKHTLRLTNTGTFDDSLLGGFTSDMKIRTSSFDLSLFKFDDEWDEGVGYDYFVNELMIPYDSQSLNSSPSNWGNAKTNTNWIGGDGVFSGSSNEVGRIHFEQGNENINLDISDVINNFITTTTATTINLGLSFDLSLEQNTVTDNLQYVGFFTRHTQTFFEPLIETINLETIKDDRSNFYLGKDNRLYLYSSFGGQPTNLDALPIVTILDSSSTPLITITALQATKGVYYIELNIDDDGQNDCTMYNDVWSNIVINGNVKPDIELEFSVKGEGYFNIGSDTYDTPNYGFTFKGIKMNESVYRGDIRKVVVNVKIPYTSNQSAPLDDLEYRLYVKEGNSQYTVIDFQPINIGFNQNYFLLDTISLVPNTYYLDIRYSGNFEVRTLNDTLRFQIVNQSELIND